MVQSREFETLEVDKERLLAQLDCEEMMDVAQELFLMYATQGLAQEFGKVVDDVTRIFLTRDTEEENRLAPMEQLHGFLDRLFREPLEDNSTEVVLKRTEDAFYVLKSAIEDDLDAKRAVQRMRKLLVLTRRAGTLLSILTTGSGFRAPRDIDRYLQALDDGQKFAERKLGR